MDSELEREPSKQRSIAPWVGHVLDLAGLALIGLVLWVLVARSYLFQPDLNTYRFAGQAVLAGLDPYIPSNLIETAGRYAYPFIYPPITLLACVAIAFAPWHPLALAWMGLKIGLLAGLIVVWARWFNRHEFLLPTALVAVFGWNRSAQIDLACGNIVMLEAALVWAGLAAFVAGRRAWFACFIVLAASFKLAPALFLLLLLVPEPGQPPRWKMLGFALLALAVVVGGPMLVGPAADFRPFWSGVPTWTVVGTDNPTIIGFSFALAAMAGWKGGVVLPVGFVLWMSFCALLLVASRSFLRRCWELQDARLWVMTAAFLYILMMPRPMDYGFVLLTPAVLYFSPSPFRGSVGRWSLALIVSAQGLLRETFIVSDSPLFAYAPFLLNVCVWLLVLNDSAKEARATKQNAGTLPQRFEAVPAS